MKEKEIQQAIIKALSKHPMVVWCYVTTVGTVKGAHGGRMFKVGFSGQSDIMGQLTDGRILAVEVKQPGKEPTEVQADFIALVNKYGGVAGWADSVEVALEILEKASL